MNLKIIDAHTHVQFPEFDDDRDDVIKHSFEDGIGMINIGCDVGMSAKAISIAERYEDGVWASVGIHPSYAHEINIAESVKELERMSGNSKVVAVGECGLDYFRLGSDEYKEKQRELFILQLELSKRIGKPIVLHIRTSTQKSTDAFDDVLKILEPHRNFLVKKQNVCHFFTGTKEIAKKFLDLNFSFTFGGLITFNRGFDDVLNYIPVENMLVETDAPFVSPKSNRGKRNEPSFIKETANFLADFKKVDIDVFLHNTSSVFGLDI